MQRDWCEYGEGCFSFNILVKTDEASARKIEQEYIAEFDTIESGYNIAGATGEYTDNSEQRCTRFRDKLWEIIKKDYLPDGNLYLFDLFSVSYKMKLIPSELLHQFGIDRARRMNVGITLSDDNDDQVYVCINWNDEGIYLAACDLNWDGENGQLIYV